MKRQRGAVLLVSLMVLIVLSLLAVSAVNMSTVNLRIVSNMQAVKRGDSAGEQAIEAVLANPAYFTTDRTSTITLSLEGGTVTIGPRVCLYSESLGDTSSWATPGETALWRVSATYVDPVTHTTTTITRGARIVMQGNANCI